MTQDRSGPPVAMVTGACGAIGQAIVAALERDGAIVVATDVVACAGIEHLDVTSAESWRAIMAKLADRHGALDVLINNAAIAPVTRIADLTLTEWRRVQAVNVEAALLGMQAALPLLTQSGAGREGGSSVINIASAAANCATALTAAYCTSKAALVMLSKVAAIEFANDGRPIRVNTVNPGAVASPMLADIARRHALSANRPVEEIEAGMLRDVPMGRLTRPDDVADAVAWLASRGSRFVTGTELHVDGGFTAG